LLNWASIEQNDENEKPNRIQQYGYKIIQDSKKVNIFHFNQISLRDDQP